MLHLWSYNVAYLVFLASNWDDCNVWTVDGSEMKRLKKSLNIAFEAVNASEVQIGCRYVFENSYKNGTSSGRS